MTKINNMKTKELIQKLQELDPSGELEVVAETNDGYAYNVFGGKVGGCMEGIVNDENNDVLILDATN